MTPNPLDHPVCLDHPLWLEQSAWTEHIPFAMYLISTIRPSRFVELGTYYGVSYCAFCQAAKKLGLATEFFAIDTWQGDEQAGEIEETVFENLKTHHDQLYGQFSTLVRSSFDVAVERFENGSIDLLHIDGLHTYEAAKHDFETWLPKMSCRGIILFHDVCERADDFGVWKLWDELTSQYPSFLFVHEHGLGVLVVGKKIPDGLAGLFSADEAEAGLIRDFFRRLGASIKAISEYEQQREYIDLLKTHEATVMSSPVMRLYRILRFEGVSGLIRKLKQR